ncbi:putative toxin-antitoxin system toxin component, PIN family [Patescibacteria group bacterium]|nr:putative toxin-antitoxin system toxin component, PIN family [Patescibacteria group bacterium]MCG2702021.1 putative toxin-antitoxin system toxin component, PIN family [Candidatus Parcubacteria bacterium]MBU4265541.1 putative toxin-antitoxin system toxin component, PIN family [Patescibacteria group bacterium]MBU4389870.1 putative toxin-antitoxin system toxin component, PIN family [Patescibacteria group bacterium]MBU4397257.1 putative toxin-antitoxin system toxin component, PIN family [Patescib
MKIVLDSDVIIAGLISKTGAGNFLLRMFLDDKLQVLSSKEQTIEIENVLKRGRFRWEEQKSLWDSFKKKTKKIKILDLNECGGFVLDENDAHILALAVLGKVSFLLSYNIKDFFIDKIKDKYGVLIVRPGYFIQFCRGKNIL